MSSNDFEAPPTPLLKLMTCTEDLYVFQSHKHKILNKDDVVFAISVVNEDLTFSTTVNILCKFGLCELPFHRFETNFTPL